MSEIKYLFKCPNCGQIYKLCKLYTGDTYDGYITDYNDVFMVDKYDNVMHQNIYDTKCIKCKEVVPFEPNTKCTYDWVANKVFEIKG